MNRWVASSLLNELVSRSSSGRGCARDRREVPPLREPTHSQERMRKAKASVRFGRNDRFVVGLKK